MNEEVEVGQALPGLSVRPGREGLSGADAGADESDAALGSVEDGDIVRIGERVGVGGEHSAGTDGIAEHSHVGGAAVCLRVHGPGGGGPGRKDLVPVGGSCRIGVGRDHGGAEALSGNFNIIKDGRRRHPPQKCRSLSESTQSP